MLRSREMKTMPKSNKRLVMIYTGNGSPEINAIAHRVCCFDPLEILKSHFLLHMFRP
jgi:hypothetical protein